jgi:dCMP deaminase
MTKYDNAMIQTAHIFAKQSYCNRLQVGAVLAKDGRILATGYNGTIAGTSNCCEDESGVTSEFTLHAEQNIITFCAKNGIPTEGASIYITHSPCKMCSKLIAQAGIIDVIYSIDYRDAEGLDFLNACGIKTRKVEHGNI